MEKDLDMDKILDGVYLGGIKAACDADTLKEMGITHILTIDQRPLSMHYTKGLKCKHIQALDLPDVDLLTKFPECFQFIEEALESGGILIHCYVGQSRSATVSAAYIMYKEKITVDKALDKIKEQRPRIRPNEGFMYQLKLFEKMGCCIDKNNEIYRKYRLNQLALRMQTGGQEEELEGMLVENPVEAQNRGDLMYKCRKCRKPLFRQSGILSHSVGEGEAAFDWRCRVPANKRSWELDMDKTDEACDRSLFIEPVQWMADSILEFGGKLSCPKCDAKIGSYKWHGEKCPCGTWVAPAFHIQKSKVDECVPRPPPPAVQPQLPTETMKNLTLVTQADIVGTT